MRLAILSGCILFFALATKTLCAQPVVIKGTIPGYADREIVFRIFREQFLYTEKELAKTSTDDKGRFEVRLDLPVTGGVFADIEGSRKILFAEPGRTYHITYPSPPDDSPLQLTDDDSLELNTLIRQFDSTYAAFREKHYNTLIARAGRGLVDTFIYNMHRKYEHVRNPYFRNYITYELAEIAQVSSANRQELIYRYFTTKPVQLYNLSYMYAFNNYFRKYLHRFSAGDVSGLQPYIDTVDYTGLMQALRTDSLLANDSLAGLAALRGLADLVSSGKYDRQDVLALIDSISVKSKIAALREAAGIVYGKLGRLLPGTKAPGFSLLSLSGDTVSSADFRGRYVYLTFWESACAPCINELDLLKTMQPKYDQHIAFVSISLDASIETVSRYVSDSDYNWTMLHAADNRELLKQYDIVSLPAYYLIDPKGNILKAPAERPSRNIETTFHRIANKR